MSVPNADHTSAVVTVGDGRGFIIETDDWRFRRLIITAAHCLPHLPPCIAASYTEERTYPDLIGRLNDQSPKVWTECLFADPVGDIAVLGGPDDQELPEQADAYDQLTQKLDDQDEPQVPALRVAEAENGPAWLLTLDGRWAQCHVETTGNGLWITRAAVAIQGGMSGSPILSDDGLAIGAVCLSSGGADLDSHTEGGPNPGLKCSLPGWLLRAVET